MSTLTIVQGTTIVFLCVLAVQLIPFIYGIVKKRSSRGNWGFVGALGIASFGLHFVGEKWISPVLSAQILAVVAVACAIVQGIRVFMGREPISSPFLIMLSVASYMPVIFLQALPAIVIACALSLILVTASTLLALREAFVATVTAS